MDTATLLSLMPPVSGLFAPTESRPEQGDPVPANSPGAITMGNVNSTKTFLCTATLGFYYFSCFYGSGADIQSDQVIFFSENHERCLILKNFVFVHRF